MIAFETDIHAVAGLLKRYFRELPDPLFTDDLYLSFVQALGEGRGGENGRRWREESSLGGGDSGPSFHQQAEEGGDFGWETH